MHKKQPPLYLALDAHTIEGCHAMAALVREVDGDFGFKLNQDLLMQYGAGKMVREFAETYGRPVFADVKMWNGGRTMESTIANLAEAGAAITNVYAHAGKKALERALKSVAGTNLQVFGLGILTHYTEEYCQAVYRSSLPGMVRQFAEMCLEAGLPGYILPGTCLEEVSDLPLLKLVPAVRPDWFEDKQTNDQEQTVAPFSAFLGGATTVVCGSPVFKSADPADALRRILAEITEARFAA